MGPISKVVKVNAEFIRQTIHLDSFDDHLLPSRRLSPRPHCRRFFDRWWIAVRLLCKRWWFTPHTSAQVGHNFPIVFNRFLATGFGLLVRKTQINESLAIGRCCRRWRLSHSQNVLFLFVLSLGLSDFFKDDALFSTGLNQQWEKTKTIRKIHRLKMPQWRLMTVSNWLIVRHWTIERFMWVWHVWPDGQCRQNALEIALCRLNERWRPIRLKWMPKKCEVADLPVRHERCSNARSITRPCTTKRHCSCHWIRSERRIECIQSPPPSVWYHLSLTPHRYRFTFFVVFVSSIRVVCNGKIHCDHLHASQLQQQQLRNYMRHIVFSVRFVGMRFVSTWFYRFFSSFFSFFLLLFPSGFASLFAIQFERKLQKNREE